MDTLFGIYNRISRNLAPADLAAVSVRLKFFDSAHLKLYQNDGVALNQVFFNNSQQQSSFLGNPLSHRYQISGQCRLDNRDELTHALKVPSHTSDCDLIKLAYHQWREACTSRLLGDFCFAIWDKEQRSIYCARDHFGVIPLYYHLSAKLFAFSSATEVLRALASIPDRLNESRIADFLLPELEGIDKTSTFYQEISRLPPAHWLLVEEHSSHCEQYWQLRPKTCGGEKRSDQLSEFKAIFTDSVNCRLKSPNTTGVLLSGGLDSSAIVAIARQRVESPTQNLTTFSVIGEDEDDSSEARHINAVLNQGGQNAHKIDAHNVNNAQSFDDVFAIVPEPFDTSMGWIAAAYNCAKTANMQTVLDGVDGDLVTSVGTYYVAQLLRNREYREAAKELSGLRRFYQTEVNVPLLFAQSCYRAFAPQWLKYSRTRIKQRIRLADVVKDSIISIDFAKRIELSDRLLTLNSHTGNVSSIDSAINHAQSLTHPYVCVALERYYRVASTYGITPSHPFFDKRLVEFCVNTPWDFKTKNGWPKVALREITKDILPESVRWRCDFGDLGWLYTQTLIRHYKLSLQKLCESHLDLIQPYVDIDQFRKVYKAFFIQNNQAHAETVWEIASLIVWLKRQASTQQVKLH